MKPWRRGGSTWMARCRPYRLKSIILDRRSVHRKDAGRALVLRAGYSGTPVSLIEVTCLGNLKELVVPLGDMGASRREVVLHA